MAQYESSAELEKFMIQPANAMRDDLLRNIPDGLCCWVRSDASSQEFRQQTNMQLERTSARRVHTKIAFRNDKPRDALTTRAIGRTMDMIVGLAIEERA